MGFGAGDTNLYRYVGNNSTNATDPTGMWINFAIGAAIGGVLDLGLQLWEQKGDFSKIDPTRLAISTISGALGGGIGGALGKGGALLRGTALAEKGLGLGARTAINAGAGFNLGYYGKVAENSIKGNDLTEGALFTGIAGGAGAAAGELLQAGVGAAWSKYTRLDRVGKQLDNMAAETQDLIRQLDDLEVANQRLKVESSVAESLEARSGSKFGAFSQRADEFSTPYLKKGVMNYFDPLRNGTEIESVQSYIKSGRLKGEIIKFGDILTMSKFRSNISNALEQGGFTGYGKVRNGVTKNISFADVLINNNKALRVQGFSGSERVSGNYIGFKSSNRKLTTKVLNGVDRSHDPEAKILESLLARTKKHDTIEVVLPSERPICASCLGVISQFLELRPNASIKVIGSIIP
jgi:hypothetical protein